MDEGAEVTLIIPANCPVDLVNEAFCHGSLDDAGVELTEAVDGVIKEYKGSTQEIRRVVARSTPVEDGQDGRIEWLG